MWDILIGFTAERPFCGNLNVPSGKQVLCGCKIWLHNCLKYELDVMSGCEPDVLLLGGESYGLGPKFQWMKPKTSPGKYPKYKKTRGCHFSFLMNLNSGNQ